MDDEEDFGEEIDLEEFFHNHTPRAQSVRFQRVGVIVLAFDLLAGIAGAVSSTLMDARNCAAMHANWRFDQDNFHEQAAREIETLIAGEESEQSGE